MNRFFTLLLVFLAGVCSAQHVATVSDNSNFHTITDGKVVSVFVLDQELNEFEMSAFENWVQDNATLVEIEKSGLTITTSFPVNYNERNVYTKLFRTLGVNEVKVRIGSELQQMELQDFFQHFDL